MLSLVWYVLKAEEVYKLSRSPCDPVQAAPPCLAAARSLPSLHREYSTAPPFLSSVRCQHHDKVFWGLFFLLFTSVLSYFPFFLRGYINTVITVYSLSAKGYQIK